MRAELPADVGTGGRAVEQLAAAKVQRPLRRLQAVHAASTHRRMLLRPAPTA